MKNVKNKIWYPSIQQVISYNKKIINKYRVTKAEKHQILSRQQISHAIKETKDFPGNIEDKAAILVRKLQYHPFGSANRRTAYFTMNKFLWQNRLYSIVKKKIRGKEFMSKIRKHEYTHDQIKKEISYEK